MPETIESRRLCEEISSATGGVCLLGFSRGKDSIAAWLYLRRFFSRIIPFHLASIPHLSWVDASLDYYEKFFGTPIFRCLSGGITHAFSNGVYQPPDDEPAILDMLLWQYDTHDVAQVIRRETGNLRAWCAFGINKSDSIDRRIYVGKNMGRNPKRRTFYPCFDWTKAMILAEIDSAGVKLPGDYQLANRSLAALPRYRHLRRMQEVYPDDYERVKTMFPLIEAELARYEFAQQSLTQSPAQSRDASVPLPAA